MDEPVTITWPEFPKPSFSRALLLAGGAALLLHALALGSFYYYLRSGKPSVTKLEIEMETIVLGNIGGNPGSIQGERVEETVIAEKPLTPTEVPIPAPVATKVVSQAELNQAREQLGRLLEEARKTSQTLVEYLPDLSTLQPSLEFPSFTLPKVAPEVLERFSKESINGLNKLSHQIDQRKLAEKSLEEWKRLLKEEQSKLLSQMEEFKKKQEAKKQQGNAATNGNNRTGIGERGEGGNNNGETRDALEIKEFCLAPGYPYDSWLRKEQGSPVVAFTCLRNGDVSNVRLIESCGYSQLDEAALAAVRTWKMKPALVLGLPVESGWTKRINFVIK